MAEHFFCTRDERLLLQVSSQWDRPALVDQGQCQLASHLRLRWVQRQLSDRRW